MRLLKKLSHRCIRRLPRRKLIDGNCVDTFHGAKQAERGSAQGEGRKKAKNYRFFRNISALAHAMNRKKAPMLDPNLTLFSPHINIKHSNP